MDIMCLLRSKCCLSVICFYVGCHSTKQGHQRPWQCMLTRVFIVLTARFLALFMPGIIQKHVSDDCVQYIMKVSVWKVV